MIPIEYPTLPETEREIGAILSRAMPKHSLFSRMRELIFQVGLRRLFIGMGDIFFILLFSSGLSAYAVFSFCDTRWAAGTAYGAVFLFSPLSFSLVYLLCILKEKEEGSWEVQMTCRYTFLELFSFRTLCFSLLSLVLNGVSNGVSSFFTATNDFWKMNALSACSLLLFSVLLLVIPSGRFPAISVLLPSLIWAAGFFPYSRHEKEWERLLCLLPDYVYGGLAVLLAIVYLKRLSTLCSMKKRREIHAFY